MKRHRKQHPACPQWILEGVRKIRESAVPAMPEKPEQATEPKE